MEITLKAEVIRLGNNENSNPRVQLQIEGQQDPIEIEMSSELVSKFWDKLYKTIEVEINFKGID